MQERIASNFKKTVALKAQADEQKGFQDLLNNRIEKIGLKVTTFSDTFKAKLSELTESMEDKFKAVKEKMTSESVNVAHQFDKTKKY